MGGGSFRRVPDGGPAVRRPYMRIGLRAFAVSLALAASGSGAQPVTPVTPVTPALGRLRAVGKVDPRFLAYNVEMVEVAGGNFWAPYRKPGEPPPVSAEGPQGVAFSSGTFRRREPIDLSDKRLRMLAAALGPSYMRVSGSWANSIYFQNDDRPAVAPPTGYQGVLTRAQWRGVIDFGHAVDARILTSFASSAGAHDANGGWDPDGARRLFAYTRSLGGTIDAVELVNEPNASRTPYSPADFARDEATLRTLVERVSPQTKIVGPGSTGEAGFRLFAKPRDEMSTTHLLSGEPTPKFDVFSHHFYGAVSERCASLGKDVNTSPAEALTEGWLSRADQAQTYYAGLRDRFAPGAQIWITETAQSACGGDRWSATFLDSFRFVDQLGRLAKQQASIVFHNTLAASDYALIDEVSWQPRPNYWAALLWRRLMGEIVLDAGANAGSLHVYAQCLRGRSGGVALVAVNLDPAAPAQLRLTRAAERYTLTADELQSRTVKLNGRPLALTARDTLPPLVATPTGSGMVPLAPASISFLAIPGANNQACR